VSGFQFVFFVSEIGFLSFLPFQSNVLLRGQLTTSLFYIFALYLSLKYHSFNRAPKLYYLRIKEEKEDPDGWIRVKRRGRGAVLAHPIRDIGYFILGLDLPIPNSRKKIRHKNAMGF